MATDIKKLQTMKISELTKIALEMELPEAASKKKQELIFGILEAKSDKESQIHSTGVLEILPDGYGFLRSIDYNYLPGPDDVYISPSQIKRFSLKTGDTVSGQIRPPKDNERFFALLKVERVNDENPEKAREIVLFDNLTPLYPEEKIDLETEPNGYSMRIMNLLTPIGKGQRGLIVAQPKTGK